jgi:hypothetical protein
MMIGHDNDDDDAADDGGDDDDDDDGGGGDNNDDNDYNNNDYNNDYDDNNNNDDIITFKISTYLNILNHRCKVVKKNLIFQPQSTIFLWNKLKNTVFPCV